MRNWIAAFDSYCIQFPVILHKPECSISLFDKENWCCNWTFWFLDISLFQSSSVIHSFNEVFSLEDSGYSLAGLGSEASSSKLIAWSYSFLFSMCSDFFFEKTSSYFHKYFDTSGFQLTALSSSSSKPSSLFSEWSVITSAISRLFVQVMNLFSGSISPWSSRKLSHKNFCLSNSSSSVPSWVTVIFLQALGVEQLSGHLAHGLLLELGFIVKGVWPEAVVGCLSRNLFATLSWEPFYSSILAITDYFASYCHYTWSARCWGMHRWTPVVPPHVSEAWGWRFAITPVFSGRHCSLGHVKLWLCSFRVMYGLSTLSCGFPAPPFLRWKAAHNMGFS